MTPQDFYYIVASICMIIGLGLGIGLAIKIVKMFEIITKMVSQIQMTTEQIGEQKSAITPIVLPLVISIIKKFIPERR